MFEQMRGTLASAGITPHSCTVALDSSFTDEEIDATFRQVLRARLEWSLREGMRLFPEAVALWNTVR